MRPTGRHVHGPGQGARGGRGRVRCRGVSPAAVRHVPVVVRDDVRAGARGRRVHREPGHREDRSETVQDYRVGHRPRVRHLLPGRQHQRHPQLEREQALPRGKL